MIESWFYGRYNMASTNVSNRIKCEHSKECSSYSCWIGNGKSSKCFRCKNNKYQDPGTKKDFYEADAETWMIDTITTIVIIGLSIGLCALIFWI